MATILLKKINKIYDSGVQAVFDAAPAGSSVYLEPGIYRQKVMIRTPDLTLIGSGWDTVIVWDDHAKKPHPIGWEYNTFRTYTLAVCADGRTVASNLLTALEQVLEQGAKQLVESRAAAL